MAPKKQKATAPTATVPVKTHDGRPTRAEKSAVNKAVYDVVRKESNAATRAKIAEVKKPIQDSVKEERKIGRPPNPDFPWTDELGEQLFSLIATGSTLREVAQIEDGPSLYQLLKWLADDTHPFSKIHARAKELLVPLFEDDARALTQQPTRYAIVTNKQVVTRDGDVEDLVEQRVVDNVERAKLAFQGLQWTLGHLKPKKHGRSADAGTGGKNEQLEGLFAALKAGPVE